MSIYRGLEAVLNATGDGHVDWDAAARAAKETTPAGTLDLEPEEKQGYVSDVRAARDQIRSISGLSFSLPETIEVIHRHHWIDYNIDMFKRVMKPLNDRPIMLPGLSRRINTTTIATMLSFLSRHVLGQYDPVLLGGTDAHNLYFVRPNILTVADELNVEYNRFRRWIIFHEVTHAAEFGTAPWLSTHLETAITHAIDELSSGRFDRESFNELDQTMTVVEGYAEFIMDHAFDDDYSDLREKVEARRRGQGPIEILIRYALGLGIKRRQYERGKAFFEYVFEHSDESITTVVWADPTKLPTDAEIENPELWLTRVVD